MERNTRMIYTNNKQKRNRRKPKKILFFLLILFIGAASFLGYLAYQTYTVANESYSELDRGTKSNLRDEEVYLSKNPVSILFIGVENYSSGGAGGRADSLIVGTFNPELKTMKLVSIPRDTRTYIPSEGEEDKINHSFNFGKDETLEAVENLLDIPIDYYVMVNFEGFKSIVDEIGGVEVEVPFDFWEYTDTQPREKLYFYEGIHSLNGEEALAYARMRKRDPRGDFGRNDRQKQIIEAAIDSLAKPNNILKIDDIAMHIGNNVETNLRISDGLAFQKKYNGFSSKNIETLSLEGEDAYINGVYYFEPSDESLTNVSSQLQSHLEFTNTMSASADEEVSDELQ